MIPFLHRDRWTNTSQAGNHHFDPLLNLVWSSLWRFLSTIQQFHFGLGWTAQKLGNSECPGHLARRKSRQLRRVWTCVSRNNSVARRFLRLLSVPSHLPSNRMHQGVQSPCQSCYSRSRMEKQRQGLQVRSLPGGPQVPLVPENNKLCWMMYGASWINFDTHG